MGGAELLRSCLLGYLHCQEKQQLQLGGDVPQEQGKDECTLGKSLLCKSL